MDKSLGTYEINKTIESLRKSLPMENVHKLFAFVNCARAHDVDVDPEFTFTKEPQNNVYPSLTFPQL